MNITKMLMLLSLQCVVGMNGAQKCDMEVQESSSSNYQAQILRPNATELRNVKEMEIVQYGDQFSIDSNNAILQTIRKIDREGLCKQQQSCDCSKPVCLIEITILVLYLPSTSLPPHRININVCVIDVNDNKPSFPEATQTLEINENAANGTEYDLQSASDLDSEKYGILRYELRCDRDILRLSYEIMGVDAQRSDHRVKVSIQGKVRYEAEPWMCNISACDLEYCTSSKVMIKINDVNDHRPQWKRPIYYKIIKENTVLDTVIGRYVAEDADPVYGRLTYSIARITSPMDLKVSQDGSFILDSFTGELRINKNLDYEESWSRRLEIIIVAMDNGVPILSSSTTVQISLENVNDNAPNIRLNKAILDIKENTEPGYLDYFKVTDDDEMEIDKVRCRITDPERSFHLKRSGSASPILFEIHSDRRFDYEKESRLEVVIRCEDGGSPVLWAVKRVTVNVMDVNDNSVYFPQKIIRAYLPENAPIGTEVTKLLAADLDRKSSLTYSLVDPNNSTFVNIDSHHGYITTNEILDRESKDLFVFQVKVEEKDVGNFSDTAEVQLRITDVNDNYPVFKDSYSFNLAENVTVNALIGTVQASDIDLGSNGTIIYYAAPSPGKSHEYFRVAINGAIRLAQQLDFETQSIHNLVIIAKDQGTPHMLSSSTSVIIRVLDSNDHPPRFEDRNTPLNLPCQSQDVGKDLIIVSDRDQDPSNTMINYDIEKIEPMRFRTLFAINRTTGFISMTVTKDLCKFKYASRERVDLTLRIFDPTKPEFKDRANLVIYLEGDRYDLSSDKNHKNNKYDGGSKNRFVNPKQKPGTGEGDGPGRQDEFMDQNVIIVMILIFITIFLGIILISLVCFIKRRRQADFDQDVSEGVVMIGEKVDLPVEHGKFDYRKGSESYNFTMKNVGANAEYYQTMSDNAKRKTKEVNMCPNSLQKPTKIAEGTVGHYETSTAMDPHAYHTLIMNPRLDEQYSMMESLATNSPIRPHNKTSTELIGDKSINSASMANRRYVSVSFV